MTKGKIKLNKLQIVLILMLLVVLAIYFLKLNNTFINISLAIITMVLCVCNIYRSRNNILGFILHFQLFYYNYSVIFSRYLHISSEYNDFYINADGQTLSLGIICLLIFEIFMTFCYKENKHFKNEYIYAKQKNNYISIFLLIIAFFVGILCFDWNSYGNRFAITPYYEYIGILLILGLYYTGYNKSKINKYGYSILIFALILQGLVYGERVSALQFLFIWLFYFRGENLKTKNIFLFSILGIFAMTFIGSYRSTYNLNDFNLNKIWNVLSGRLFTFNGADLGYYCSLTFIMVAKKVSISTRIEMLMKFLLSIFIGNSKEANLTVFTRKYYTHWYGGFYPLYFYFYGGIKLVLLMSYAWCSFLCKCIKQNISKHSDFLYLLGMYLICITARWYMYTPLNAFRPALLFSIAYLLLSYANKLFRK